MNYLITGTPQKETNRIIGPIENPSISRYYLDEHDLSPALDEARTEPMFGHRVIIISRTKELFSSKGNKDDQRNLVEYLEEPSRATLIIQCESPDRRLRFFKSARDLCDHRDVKAENRTVSAFDLIRTMERGNLMGSMETAGTMMRNGILMGKKTVTDQRAILMILIGAMRKRGWDRRELRRADSDLRSGACPRTIMDRLVIGAMR